MVALLRVKNVVEHPWVDDYRSGAAVLGFMDALVRGPRAMSCRSIGHQARCRTHAARGSAASSQHQRRQQQQL